MRVACPSCGKTLEYSGERPRFCAFCGQSFTAMDAPTIAPEPGPPEPALTPPPTEAADSVERVEGSRAEPSVPETIGGYRLLRRLGGGGMGAVHEAEEIASGRRVALKLVLPEYAGAADTYVRFRQEGRLASTLVHPRCVFVLTADEEAGRPFIVMELMPGETLDDLVRQRGPLPVEEALVKILDVIEGLEQAHQRGLVHRDVKPSNCFLEANGRVKIGDFGLARSLVADNTKLTRTGAFIGTPLYAAPEQIHKNDPTDAQSDVYSVAATLYFLLTGQAPFQKTGDVVATLARIVSETPQPMRSLRRGLPRALDKVVLRGLQRDRRRRWKDLASLRRALLRFLPMRPSAVGLGLRLGAFLIDLFLLGFPELLHGLGLEAIDFNSERLVALSAALAEFAVNVVYFGLFDGLLGWTPGKRLLGIRVGAVAGVHAPGLARAVLRIVSLYAMFHLSSVLADTRLWVWTDDEDALAFFEGLGMVLYVGCFAVFLAINVWLMRESNGYRGLHELLSGTRTYQVAWQGLRERRVVVRQPYQFDLTQPDGLPERIGPYLIEGAITWSEHQRIVCAADLQLGRTLWLWLRPASAAHESAQRDIGRATRLRWIASGMDGGWCWEAFLAPAGMPLSALAAQDPRLSWADVRPILEELAEELDAACSDGTLPAMLTVEQVWIAPDGRVQLLDAALQHTGTPLERMAVAGANDASGEQARALAFLGTVAVITLEGAERSTAEAGQAMGVPLPVHARRVLNGLLAGHETYESVAAFRHDLDAIRDRPAEVTRKLRAGHLAFLALLVNLPLGGLAWMLFVLPLRLLLAPAIADEYNGALLLTVIGLNYGYWVLWSYLFRGGYAYTRGSIALCRKDGSPPTHLQCGLRAFLVWTPVIGLYTSALLVALWDPALVKLYFGLWTAATLLLPLYVLLAILMPRHGLHDRIVGTYLVPR